MNYKIFLVILTSLISGFINNPEKEFSPKNFNLVKISDGVFACIHKFGGLAICNSGIVDNGESTIIFDTFLSPDAAEELMETVKYLKLSPVKYVINSHYHNDHIRGNQSFSSEVKILSTKRTAELIKQKEPEEIAAEKIYGKQEYEHFDSLSRTFKGDTLSKEYQEIKMMKPYFEELSKSSEKIRTRLPDTYIVNEKSLNGSRRKIILLDKGKGHSESDLIMYLPEDGILFTGDLVFNKSHPYLGDGNPQALKKILGEMESMDVKVVIPGHGDPGGKETIAIMRSYIESIEDIVKEIKNEKKGSEDLVSIRMPEKYKDWWLGDYFLSNLKFVFNANSTN